MKSEVLSDFWGRDMFLEAGVVLPPNHRAGERLPVCYYIHGFGGSHTGAWRSGLAGRMAAGSGYPRLIVVFPNSTFSLGHHIWADSVNTGPWGQAFTEELVPAIQRHFGGYGKPEGRFLSGHSSGGHSSLWLQVAYPDFFGGVWSGAPDPVDFRDFIGIDIYEYENAYTNPDGDEVMFVRKGEAWITSIRKYTKGELGRRAYGGQMASFDAVFSPRGEDGRPMALFDRKTGVIDPFVAGHWKNYDISLKLRENWDDLGPRLAGKLHIYVGTLDSYRLDGAVRLLDKELTALGSDAEIVYVEGRNHRIFAAHPELWPEGLMEMTHREMVAEYQARREQ